MLNRDLLQITLGYIEEHPEEWDQKYWFCGTGACFAGRACLLSGDVEDGSCYVRTHDGIPRSVYNRAKELLGLSERQADHLFQAENTLEDLQRIVNELLK